MQLFCFGCKSLRCNRNDVRKRVIAAITYRCLKGNFQRQKIPVMPIKCFNGKKRRNRIAGYLYVVG